MLRRTLLGILTGTALALPVVAAVPAPAAVAEAAPLAITITYDDSAAAEFRSVVAQGIQVWNSTVVNVRIVKAAPGTRANVRVIADNGWPRATLGPVRPGRSGTVWMGRQAVQQGHNPLRIASHEFGHTLGLPDRRTGRCTDLMSGSSAGTRCTNPRPSGAEASRVERSYQSGFTAQQQSGQGMVVVDAG